MSIFSKPLSQLVTADLQELLTDGATENIRLEFKSEVPNKDETLKKLSSFANTFGGFMVIGARANSADGRIEELGGVDEQSSYKQTLVQWSFGGASPPLTVEVSDPIPSPSGNGKVCYVVYVAESDVAPHFLNGRKGVWIRTDEFSSRFDAKLADENELRHLLDRRRLVLERRDSLLERARKRFDSYAAKARTDEKGNKRRLGACVELCVVPRFPARPLCEREKLEPLVSGAAMSWCGINFPRLRNNVISQHESTIILEPTTDLSIFEANIWGLLFYGAEIEGDHNGTVGIHLHQFVGYVLVFLRHASEMLQKLGYSGPVYIEVRLTSILGVQWLYSDKWVHGMFKKSGSELDDEVTFSITTASETFRDKTDSVVMDVLRYVFFSVNWAERVDQPQSLEELIFMGYDYNHWPRPVKSKDKPLTP